MNSTTKPITLQIEEAVDDIPGWSPIDQLLSLYTLAFSSAHLQGDILELGSWCGRSAIALGMAARLTGNTTLHCVDLFPEKDDWFKNEDGTYSFSVHLNGRQHGGYQDQTVWEEPFLRDIATMYESWPSTLEAFNYFIEKSGLQTCIKAHRSTLDTFAANAPEGFALRLAFIDGDHSYDAVSRDISTIEQFLLPGGWICFDDAFSSYDGVNMAIRTMIMESGKYKYYQQLTRKFFVARKL